MEFATASDRHVRAARNGLAAVPEMRQHRCVGDERHARGDLLVVCGMRFNLGRSDTPNAGDVRAGCGTASRGAAGDAARLDYIAPALEHIAASVLIVDDTGRYVAVNKKACELTGYSRAELLHKAVVDLTPPHAMDAYERLWDSFVRTMKQHGFYKIKRKDGSVLDVKYCAYTDLAPGIHISFMTT